MLRNTCLFTLLTLCTITLVEFCLHCSLPYAIHPQIHIHPVELKSSIFLMVSLTSPNCVDLSPLHVFNVFVNCILLFWHMCLWWWHWCYCLHWPGSFLRTEIRTHSSSWPPGLALCPELGCAWCICWIGLHWVTLMGIHAKSYGNTEER